MFFFFTLAENIDNKNYTPIKTEQESDSDSDFVTYLGDLFLGFPEGKMAVTWEQLSVETHLRNVITSEVEDHLYTLEKMTKKDISVTSFQYVHKSVESLMLDLKAIHASFRKKAADGGLLDNKQFVADSRAVVKWQLEIWNRLDKLKPNKMPNQAASDQASSYSHQGNVLSDTLYNLDRTLQKHNDDRDTNTNLNRPHFKGGRDCYLKFEKYQKDFKMFSRNIKDKVRLLQLLRDTLSGHARNQIEEMDLIEDNYELAWKRLEDVYAKKEECRGLLIDKIFSFQFNMPMDKFDEAFNNYCILIEKLLTSHDINLLDEETGVDSVMAHITFKKFPQTLKNVLLTLCTTHYPTFSELKQFIPKAVDRINKSNSDSTDVLTCNNVNYNNKGAKPKFDDSKKYCLFCDKEYHYSSDCIKFPTFHDRINRLKELKRCTYCGRKGHYGNYNKKDDCGKIQCGNCHKTNHRAMLCLDNMKKLACNKGLSDSELADISKIKKFNKTNATTVTTTTTVAETVCSNKSNKNTALPFAIVQLIIKNCLADCKVLFDQGSQVTLVSNKFINKFNLKSNGSKELNICGVTGQGVTRKHKIYPISIQTNDGIVDINAIAYDNLPIIQMPGYNKIINDLKNECSGLAKYPKNSDKVEIELLLGCDYYFKLVDNSECKSFDTLTLIPTKIGRIACGPYNIIDEKTFINKLNSNFVYSNFVYNNIDNACEMFTKSNLDLKSSDEINKNLVLSKIFTMENLATNKEIQSIDEKLAYDTFESEIYFDNKSQQYCVPLLFRGGFPPDPTELPTNFNLTMKRHNSLKAQLDQQKNHNTRLELQKLCMKERELQFIEPIEPDKIDTTIGHFIPAALVKKRFCDYSVKEMFRLFCKN